MKNGQLITFNGRAFVVTDAATAKDDRVELTATDNPEHVIVVPEGMLDTCVAVGQVEVYDPA